MMSTSRSLDVLEGDGSREWRSYRQLRNPECREETSAAGLLTTTTNLSKFAIEIALSKQAARQLAKSGVGVKKGTKAVISANSSVCGERTFNNLRTNFVIEIPWNEFFNTHRRFHQLLGANGMLRQLSVSRNRSAILGVNFLRDYPSRSETT